MLPFSVTHSGFEPLFFCVRGRRDNHYSNGPECCGLSQHNATSPRRRSRSSLGICPHFPEEARTPEVFCIPHEGRSHLAGPKRSEEPSERFVVSSCPPAEAVVIARSQWNLPCSRSCLAWGEFGSHIHQHPSVQAAHIRFRDQPAHWVRAARFSLGRISGFHPRAEGSCFKLKLLGNLRDDPSDPAAYLFYHLVCPSSQLCASPRGFDDVK